MGMSFVYMTSDKTVRKSVVNPPVEAEIRKYFLSLFRLMPGCHQIEISAARSDFDELEGGG